VRELLAVLVFGQVRLTAEDPRPLLQSVVKRQVLETLQHIQKHERADRPMDRQQVCQFLDQGGHVSMT